MNAQFCCLLSTSSVWQAQLEPNGKRGGPNRPVAVRESCRRCPVRTRQSYWPATFSNNTEGKKLDRGSEMPSRYRNTREVPRRTNYNSAGETGCRKICFLAKWVRVAQAGRIKGNDEIRSVEYFFGPSVRRVERIRLSSVLESFRAARDLLSGLPDTALESASPCPAKSSSVRISVRI
jgi:hypothetical protein